MEHVQDIESHIDDHNDRVYADNNGHTNDINGNDVDGQCRVVDLKEPSSNRRESDGNILISYALSFSDCPL